MSTAFLNFDDLIAINKPQVEEFQRLAELVLFSPSLSLRAEAVS